MSFIFITRMRTHLQIYGLKNPSCFLFALLFFALFLIFHSRYHYYQGATLKLKGMASERDAALLSWDSGSGYHEGQSASLYGDREALRERRNIPAFSEPSSTPVRFNIDEISQGTSSIKISGWAFLEKIDAAGNIISVVLENGQRRFGFATKQSIRKDVTYWYADGTKDYFADGVSHDNCGFSRTLQMNAVPPGEYTLCLFVLNTKTKSTGWAVTSKKITIPSSLPEMPQKPLDISLRLPQVNIRQLSIVSTGPLAATVVVDSGQILVPDKNSSNTIMYFSDLGRQTRQFHPLLVAVQLALSLLLAYALHRYVHWYRTAGLTARKSFSAIFFDNQRWIFWAMLFCFVTVYSLWLLGNWPGIMTPDSIVYWDHVKTLQFKEAGLYLFSVLMLLQIYDSPATIAAFQIIALSIIGSLVFSFVIRKGMPFLWVAPFMALFITSGPIGMYNITIWKDIPFSLLIILYAFYLYTNEFCGEMNKAPSTSKLFFMSLAGVSLCLLRPNGIVFVLPLLAIELLKNFHAPRAKYRLAILFCVMLFLFKYLFPVLWRTGISSLIKANTYAALLTARNYYSDDYLKDTEIMEKLTGNADLKKIYNPSIATDLLGKIRFDRLTKEERAYYEDIYFRRMYENLPLFLSDKVNIFFSLLHSVNCVVHGVTDNNLVADSYSPIIDRFPSVFSSPLTLRSLILAPKCDTLNRLSTKVSVFMAQGRNKMIYWDLLYPLMYLTTTVFLYRWFPASALFSLALVFQVPFLFLTIMTPSFRFLYFVHIAGMLLFPLVLLEVKMILDRRVHLQLLGSLHSSGILFLAASVSWVLILAPHLIYLVI